MGGGGVPSGGVYVQYGRIGNLKAEGKPYSRIDLYNNDGEKIQSRCSDGKAMRNRDYKHNDPLKNHTFPHEHNWNWEKELPRQSENLPPDYDTYF